MTHLTRLELFLSLSLLAVAVTGFVLAVYGAIKVLRWWREYRYMREAAKQPIDWRTPHEKRMDATFERDITRESFTFEEIVSDLIVTEDILYLHQQELARTRAELAEAQQEIARLTRLKTRHWKSYKRVKNELDSYRLEWAFLVDA